MSATEPGPRDHLITRRLGRDLRGLAPDVIDESPLDAAEAPDRLARHAMDELRREFAAVTRRRTSRPNGSTPY